MFFFIAAVVADYCHCWSLLLTTIAAIVTAAVTGRCWLQRCQLTFAAVVADYCHYWSLLLTAIAAIVTAAVTGRCWLQRCRLTFAAVVSDCYLCCWRCLCVMRCVRVVGRLAILCWWLFVVDSIWLRAWRRYVPTTYYNISICRNRTITHS